MIWEGRRQFYADTSLQRMAEILDVPYDSENSCLDAEALGRLREEKPLWTVMALAYWYADMGCSYIAHDWDSALNSWTINHVESERLDRIYQFLESLGYEMSDEEKQLQNGSHPLFAKSEAA